MIELVGSGSSSHEIGSGNSCTRSFLVPWDSRFTIAASLLGTSHPYIPFTYGKSVKIEPFPDEAAAAGGEIYPPTGHIQYTWAKLTLDYATDFSQQPWPIPKPNIRQGTSLAIRSVESSAEFMRVPARSTRWEDNTYGDPDGPIPEDDSPAGRILIMKGEITLLWDYVDSPPVGTWNAKKGCVNSSTFLGCEPESLLFLGYELSPSTKASITWPWTWQMVAKFSYRAAKQGQHVYGWNHEYRLDGWHRVKMFDGTNWTDRYDKTDFSTMFQ